MNMGIDARANERNAVYAERDARNVRKSNGKEGRRGGRKRVNAVAGRKGKGAVTVLASIRLID